MEAGGVVVRRRVKEQVQLRVAERVWERVGDRLYARVAGRVLDPVWDLVDRRGEPRKGGSPPFL